MIKKFWARLTGSLEGRSQEKPETDGARRFREANELERQFSRNNEEQQKRAMRAEGIIPRKEEVVTEEKHDQAA